MNRTFQQSLPTGDSRSFSFEALIDGQPQDLNGYTIALTAVSTSTAGVKTTMTASDTVVGTAMKMYLTLPAAQTGVPGIYDAVLTASKAGSPGPWSALGTIEIIARPA